MKRMLVLLAAALLMLLGCALGERALVNPQENYEYFMEESDGSEQLIFMMVDSVNDEADIVEKEGSVLIRTRFLMNDGTAASELATIDVHLFNFEGVRVIHMLVSMYGETQGDMYDTASNMYTVQEGGGVTVEPSQMAAEDYNAYWEHFVFPYYAPLESLAGMRQDDEHTCFLVRSDGGDTLLEYVVSTDGMVLLGMNQYERDGADSDYYLTLYTEIIRGEDVTLPENVIDAIKANETAPAGDKAA